MYSVFYPFFATVRGAKCISPRSWVVHGNLIHTDYKFLCSRYIKLDLLRALERVTIFTWRIIMKNWVLFITFFFFKRKMAWESIFSFFFCTLEVHIRVNALQALKNPVLCVPGVSGVVNKLAPLSHLPSTCAPLTFSLDAAAATALANAN